MCRSQAQGGRRCPTSRGGHGTASTASTSSTPTQETPIAPRRRPFRIDADITVVTYRDGDGQLARTAVNAAELDALKRSGRLVGIHGSGNELLSGRPAAAVKSPTLPNAGSLRDVPAPPAKPKRMSELKYREQYDSSPTTVVTTDGTLYRCCGPVSAHVIARRYPGARVVEGHHSY